MNPAFIFAVWEGIESLIYETIKNNKNMAENDKKTIFIFACLASYLLYLAALAKIYKN